jgi:hypothetical protein
MRFTVNCHKVFDEILCLMTLDKVTLSIQWAKTLRHMRAQITYFQRQSKSGCEQVIHFRPPLDGKLMVQFSCRLELKEMLEWIYWAMAAYKKDSQSLATFLKINEQDVVKMVQKSAVLQPAYFVAIHHKRKSVVMGIRGTNTTSDLLTDLHSHSVPFHEG